MAVASEHADALKTTFRHDQLGTTGTSSVNWLANLAAMNTLLGELEAARGFGEEAMMIAEETGKPFDIAMAGHWNGFIHISMGDVPAALRTLERTFQIVEEHGLDFLYPWAGIHLGTACAHSDQHDRADALLTSAARKSEKLDLVLAHIWALALLANAKVRAGIPEEAVAHASSALARAHEHGFRWLEVLALQQLAHGTSLTATTRFEEAEGFYLQAIGLADQLEARLLLADAEGGLGQAYASAGRPVEARKRLRRAGELYRSMGLSSHHQGTNTLLDRIS